MRSRPIQLLQAARSRRWVSFGVVFGLIFILSLAVVVISHRPASPAVRSAAVTYSLLRSVEGLNSSLNRRTSTGTAADYLNRVSSLQQLCQSITQNPVQTAEAANNLKVCTDVTKLTVETQRVFRPLLPILAMNPHAKNYQKLPWITGYDRQQLSRKLTLATNQLQNTTDTLQFPSQALAEVKQLQSSLNTGKGLGYYPELLAFQTTMFAERQQFWLDFGDIAGLEAYLKYRLKSQCGTLQASGDTPSVCHSPLLK